MHVCRWEFEGVVEAFLFDWAFLANSPGLLYVGNVLVFFGEHEVGASSTVRVVHPLETVYSERIGVGDVFFHYFIPDYL